MNLITREELKIWMDQGRNFQLVMTLDEAAFEAAHLPGSIHVTNAGEAKALLNSNMDIVVYCANEQCPASITAYNMLMAHGFDRVFRYAGGLGDWESAGLPLIQKTIPEAHR